MSSLFSYMLLLLGESSLRSMAVLSSRAQERRSHEKFARKARENERRSREKNKLNKLKFKLLALQSPRGFSALARLYYLVRPTKTAMLRRLWGKRIGHYTADFVI